MKITIGNNTYTEIKNLDFSPETDITSAEARINGFSADIMTDDEIEVGVNAYLYDDLNHLWAKYWLIEAVRKDKYTLSIRAESILRILDRRTMEPVMYANTSVSSIISEIFTGISNEYTLDSSFSSKTISGYCPKQSARQRLQWICFCIGAYLKTFFADKILILPVDDSVSAVPMDKTFWKPSISFGDYVTAIKATVYTFTLGTPQNTDKWVQVGQDYYIQTSQDVVLSNPNVPVTANENIVSVSDVTIINSNNISEVLSLLSAYYFQRGEVEADIINNWDYAPGDKVSIPIDESNYILGYIKSADFTFGLQAKSKIKLIQTDKVIGGKLFLEYMFEDSLIGSSFYYFPIGYNYSIENPYLDVTESSKGHISTGSISGGGSISAMSNVVYPVIYGTIRTIYRPLEPYATGTIDDEEVVDTEYYEKALISYGPIIEILSVDEVDSVTEDDKVVVEVQ